MREPIESKKPLVNELRERRERLKGKNSEYLSGADIEDLIGDLDAAAQFMLDTKAERQVFLNDVQILVNKNRVLRKQLEEANALIKTLRGTPI